MSYLEVSLREDVQIIVIKERSIAAMIERALEKELLSLIEDKPAKIILDMQNVKFFDSIGLAILIKFHYSIGKYQGKLCLCSVRPHVKKVFQMVQVDELFVIKDTLDMALERYS